MCQTHTLDDFPSELSKKVTLLKHFKNYLVDQQAQAQTETLPSDRALQLMRDMDDGLQQEAGGAGELAYVKKWVRTRHAILFRLSNKTVQVVFFDQSEILLAAEARVVCFVSKEGQRSECTLDAVFRNGRSDIAKRLKYTKDIMSRLINLQTPQPRDR
jgi:polo-like kinase 1